MPDSPSDSGTDPAEREIRPMLANSGGVVDPEDLVGRESVLDSIYTAVEQGGAKILGDRRMGKTSSLSAAAKVLRQVGHTVVQVSAETSDPATFARHLLHQMKQERTLRAALPAWEAEVGGELGINVGIASIKLTGKLSTSGSRPELDLFIACSEAARRAGPYRVIFLFDEITALAKGLAGVDRTSAEEFFHAVRIPRQQLDNVAIVLAGSIGLHHVLADMSAVNDIRSIDVGPLAPSDAMYLARCLLRGADIASDREAEVAAAIVDQCSAVPFYIQKLVERLDASGDREPTPASLESLVTSILEDDADEWEMRHYDSRIDSYYESDGDLVRRIIDEYALSTDGLTIDQLCTKLAAGGDPDQPSRDRLLGLLYRLEADHYLLRSGAVDRMATTLLTRAWRSIRRLG